MIIFILLTLKLLSLSPNNYINKKKDFLSHIQKDPESPQQSTLLKHILENNLNKIIEDILSICKNHHITKDSPNKYLTEEKQFEFQGKTFPCQILKDNNKLLVIRVGDYVVHQHSSIFMTAQKFKQLEEVKNKIQKANHPFLVKTFSIVRKGAHTYQISPYIQGKGIKSYQYDPHTLKLTLPIETWTEEQQKKAILSLLIALEHLSFSGLFHNDLHLENILITEDHISHIIDFEYSNENLRQGVVFFSDFFNLETLLAKLKQKWIQKFTQEFKLNSAVHQGYKAISEIAEEINVIEKHTNTKIFNKKISEMIQWEGFKDILKDLIPKIPLEQQERINSFKKEQNNNELSTTLNSQEIQVKTEESIFNIDKKTQEQIKILTHNTLQETESLPSSDEIFKNSLTHVTSYENLISILNNGGIFANYGKIAQESRFEKEGDKYHKERINKKDYFWYALKENIFWGSQQTSEYFKNEGVYGTICIFDKNVAEGKETEILEYVGRGALPVFPKLKYIIFSKKNEYKDFQEKVNQGVFCLPKGCQILLSDHWEGAGGNLENSKEEQLYFRNNKNFKVLEGSHLLSSLTADFLSYTANRNELLLVEKLIQTYEGPLPFETSKKEETIKTLENFENYFTQKLPLETHPWFRLFLSVQGLLNLQEKNESLLIEKLQQSPLLLSVLPLRSFQMFKELLKENIIESYLENKINKTEFNEKLEKMSLELGIKKETLFKVITISFQCLKRSSLINFQKYLKQGRYQFKEEQIEKSFQNLEAEHLTELSNEESIFNRESYEAISSFILQGKHHQYTIKDYSQFPQHLKNRIIVKEEELKDDNLEEFLQHLKEVSSPQYSQYCSNYQNSSQLFIMEEQNYQVFCFGPSEYASIIKFLKHLKGEVPPLILMNLPKMTSELTILKDFKGKYLTLIIDKGDPIRNQLLNLIEEQAHNRIKNKESKIFEKHSYENTSIVKYGFHPYYLSSAGSPLNYKFFSEKIIELILNPSKKVDLNIIDYTLLEEDSSVDWSLLITLSQFLEDQNISHQYSSEWDDFYKKLFEEKWNLNKLETFEQVLTKFESECPESKFKNQYKQHIQELFFKNIASTLTHSEWNNLYQYKFIINFLGKEKIDSLVPQEIQQQFKEKPQESIPLQKHSIVNIQEEQKTVEKNTIKTTQKTTFSHQFHLKAWIKKTFKTDHFA